MPHLLARAATCGDGWYPLAKTPSDITDHPPRYCALTDVVGNPRGFNNISARLTLDDFRDGLEKLQAVAVV
ncbi:MAG: hypothetical protein VYB59_02910 [Pseudomonadota bacterium]|nr:hypothetical protein [Pseudomonadota bacterium]